jgi:hypothetical protein
MGLNKKKKVKDWCPDQSEVSVGSKGLQRCPTCNKRLAPRVRKDENERKNRQDRCL